MSNNFDEDLEALLDAAHSALNKGPYKKAMRDLLSLSMDDIKSTVPNVSYSDYSKLLSVVEHASAANLAQSALRDNIVALGNTALRIAKTIPSLAMLLA